MKKTGRILVSTLVALFSLQVSAENSTLVENRVLMVILHPEFNSSCPESGILIQECTASQTDARDRNTVSQEEYQTLVQNNLFPVYDYKRILLGACPCHPTRSR